MNSDEESGGKIFRNAWVKGVTDHCEDPKPGYRVPYDEMPPWEQKSAEAVFELIRSFVIVSDGECKKLTRQEKGQLVSILWNGLVHKHDDEPKESYVRPWEGLYPWHKETDIEIFEAVQNAVEPELVRKCVHEGSRKLAS